MGLVFANKVVNGYYSTRDINVAYYRYSVEIATGIASNKVLYVSLSDGSIAEHRPMLGDVLIPQVFSRLTPFSIRSHRDLILHTVLFPVAVKFSNERFERVLISSPNLI